MKLTSHLAILLISATAVCVHAAPVGPTQCPKDMLGGSVTSTKMEGLTLVIGYEDARNNIRIRKKDDAAVFVALSKLKVGDTHCYPDDTAISLPPR